MSERMMSDRIESRISEIRERLAVDASAEHDEFKRRLAVYAIDMVDGFDALDEAPRQLCSDVASWCQQRIAEERADLEALLAEREGMKAEIEALREDLRLAAGELLVPIPEPGSDMSRLLSANVLLRRENERLRAERYDAIKRAQSANAFEAKAEDMCAAFASVLGMDEWDTPDEITAALRARLSAPLDPSSAPSETPKAPKDPIVQRALEMGLNTRVW
jgi:hypothetical protein